MKLRQSHFVPSVPYLMAGELGLLDGLDVETTRTASSAAQLEGLIAGTQDLAVTAIDNLFEWTRAGADLRLVAQVERTTPLGVYVRADNTTVSDLAGSRFAVDALANGFALVARRMLSDAQVEAEYVVVGGVHERFEALLAGEIDATLLGPPFSELAEQSDMRSIASVNTLLPDFPGQGLVVRAAIADSNALHDYLGALVRATDHCGTLSTDEGVEILNRSGLDGAAATAWEARPRSLEVDPSGLALLTDIRRSLGMLPRDVELGALWDPAPLRRAMQSAKQ